MDVDSIKYFFSNLSIVMEFIMFSFSLFFIVFFAISIYLFGIKYLNHISKRRTRKIGWLIETVFYILLCLAIIGVLIYSMAMAAHTDVGKIILSMSAFVFIFKFIAENFDFVNKENQDNGIIDYKYLLNTLTKWNTLLKQVFITCLYFISLILFLYLLIRYPN